MSRGFIKRVDGALRMRFVKAGYNANDLSVPANAVIFDSDAQQYLQVYISGSAVVYGAADYQVVATFPSLGYVPMLFASWRGDNTTLVPLASVDDGGFTAVATNYIETNTSDLGGYPRILDYIIFRGAT